MGMADSNDSKCGDHDLLIRVVTLVEGQAEDIAEIKEQLKSRPCPSDMCKAHHDDIQRLKYRNEIMVWAFGASMTVIATVVAIITMTVI